MPPPLLRRVPRTDTAPSPAGSSAAARQVPSPQPITSSASTQPSCLRGRGGWGRHVWEGGHKHRDKPSYPSWWSSCQRCEKETTWPLATARLSTGVWFLSLRWEEVWGFKEVLCSVRGVSGGSKDIRGSKRSMGVSMCAGGWEGWLPVARRTVQSKPSNCHLLQTTRGPADLGASSPPASGLCCSTRVTTLMLQAN